MATEKVISHLKPGTSLRAGWRALCPVLHQHKLLAGYRGHGFSGAAHFAQGRAVIHDSRGRSSLGPTSDTALEKLFMVITQALRLY